MMRARGFCWLLDFLEPIILVGVLRPPPLLTSDVTSALRHPRQWFQLLWTRWWTSRTRGRLGSSVPPWGRTLTT